MFSWPFVLILERNDFDIIEMVGLLSGFGLWALVPLMTNWNGF